MDSSSIVMGVGFLLVFLVPIFWLASKRTAKNKQLKTQFNQISQENSMQIDVLEITHRLILGFDKTAHKMLYANSDNLTQSYQVVDLAQIKRISLITPESKENGIEEVAIHFEGSSVEPIIFYDDKTDFGADAGVCKHIAQKWVEILRRA